MFKKTAWILWSISFILTGVFFILTFVHVYKTNYTFYPTVMGEVHTQKDFSNYLASYYKEYPLKTGRPIYYIPTGIFIESFKFIDNNTVSVSGYVWQKYKNAFLKILDPGIVFPEANKIKLHEAYKYNTEGKDGATTIGWYFEANFAENFDYKKYPLDLKLIALRMWPADFKNDKNIILTPDFGSYISTLPDSKFGVNPEIVSQGYSLIETFFNYKKTNYDTNFGVSKDIVGQENYLEFYYNIALKRNVLNTLITYLLPLFVVVIFSFILLVNVSDETERGILTCCATFLFVILLLHIRLRENLAEGSIVYIEYIYFILYFALIYIVLVSFLTTKSHVHDSKYFKLITANEFLILKVIFLPILFGSVLLVTKLIL